MMNIVRYKKISSDKIAANKEICRRVCKRAMAVLSIAIFIMFVVFTFFPPRIDIFKDEVTSTYGVFEFK